MRKRSGVSMAQRRKPASKGGGTVGTKFPIPDKARAKAALARIDQAKPPLTAHEKYMVRARAREVLGHATPSTKR